MPGQIQNNKGIVGTLTWEDCETCEHGGTNKGDCDVDVFQLAVNLDMEFEDVLCGLYAKKDEV